MSTGTIPPHTQAADPLEPSHSRLRFTFTAGALATLTGALSGSLSALFLWSLDAVTSLRMAHPGLILLLPVAGVLTAWVYRTRGKEAARGNDLILERVLHRNGGVPARMTALIFGSSVLSHLFGASTGREGAAVQMGGGMSALLLRACRLPLLQYQRPMLVAGIAGGFASIFGTPLAGAMFSVEAPCPSRPHFRELPVALLAGFTGDAACRAWGASHSAFALEIPSLTQFFSTSLGGAVLLGAVLYGWTGLLFIKTHHGIQSLFKRASGPWWLPPMAGGLLIAALSLLPGADSYLGLGTWSLRENAVTISSAFQQGGATDASWLCKLGLTALSLGSGFKGGEVTPLFFMGATLGNALASHFHLATPLFAGLGFVAVFAGAAHTPLTGALIATEMFGIEAAPLFAMTCWIAHLACGRSGLYSAQHRG